MIIVRECSVMLEIGLKFARQIILLCAPIRAIVWEKIAGALLATLVQRAVMKISTFMFLVPVLKTKKGHFAMRITDLRLVLLTILPSAPI